MSFEQTWTLDQRPWRDVLEVVARIAKGAALSFTAEEDDDRLTVTVEFPVEGAAELAASLSDVYDAADAAEDLDELEGEVDMDAAVRAGVATPVPHGWSHDVERHPEFVGEAPDHYQCTFDIDWGRDEPVVVYSNEADNRAGWPLILSFTDAVVEALGGEWFDP